MLSKEEIYVKSFELRGAAMYLAMKTLYSTLDCMNFLDEVNFVGSYYELEWYKQFLDYCTTWNISLYSIMNTMRRS